MGLGYTAWSFTCLVLLLMCSYGSGARDTPIGYLEEVTGHEIPMQRAIQDQEQLHAMDDDAKDDHLQMYAEDENNHLRMYSEDDHNHVHVLDGYDSHMGVQQSLDVMDSVKDNRPRVHPTNDHEWAHDNDVVMAIHGHEQLHIMDGDAKHDHDQPSPHVAHMDPSLNVFFMIEDLEKGKEMLIYFPNRDFTSSPPFFPKEKANSIPFSSTQLPFLLEMFSFQKDSPQAQAMHDTLRQCELPPIKGETKMCATSLESMLDFARAIFGVGSHFQILATAHRKKSTPTSQNPLLQNYTILEVPQEISAPSMVACHTMPYPYVVYYCHHHVSKSKVFIVSLEGEDGDRVDAVAVCHLDTSAWAHNHVSFRVLGIKPGSVPVCHFFPEDHLVLVPTLASI